MIVLSDTSPICYLILMGHIDLFPQLFQSITIPVAVCNELLNTAAQQLNLPIIGTLGILYRAGITGLIDFPTAIAQLQQTSFHVSQTLIQQLLQDYHRHVQRLHSKQVNGDNHHASHHPL